MPIDGIPSAEQIPSMNLPQLKEVFKRLQAMETAGGISCDRPRWLKLQLRGTLRTFAMRWLLIVVGVAFLAFGAYLSVVDGEIVWFFFILGLALMLFFVPATWILQWESRKTLKKVVAAISSK